MPFGEYFADFAENPSDLGPFRVGFDVLLDESVDLMRLSVDQLSALGLALLLGLSEGLVILGEPIANVFRPGHVVHRTFSTFH